MSLDQHRPKTNQNISYRNFVFTSQSTDKWTEEKIKTLISSENNVVRYMVFHIVKLEVPTVIGYIELFSNSRPAAIISFFDDSNLKLDKKRGSRKDASMAILGESLITRITGPHEFGDWTRGGQGRRNDLEKENNENNENNENKENNENNESHVREKPHLKYLKKNKKVINDNNNVDSLNDDGSKKLDIDVQNENGQKRRFKNKHPRTQRVRSNKSNIVRNGSSDQSNSENDKKESKPRKFAKGGRCQFEIIKSKIESGVPLEQIAADHFVIWVKHRESFEKYQQYISQNHISAISASENSQ